MITLIPFSKMCHLRMTGSLYLQYADISFFFNAILTLVCTQLSFIYPAQHKYFEKSQQRTKDRLKVLRLMLLIQERELYEFLSE